MPPSALVYFMKVLVWAGHHDVLDGAIKFFTHGAGSHVAALRKDDHTVHEAFWPRVRDRLYTNDDRKLAQAFELEGLTLADHDKFERLFDDNIKRHVGYSIWDLFRYALNMPVKDETQTFCSRYFLHCCHKVVPHKMPLVRLPFGDWGSPRDVLISPRLHGPLPRINPS